MSIRINGEKYVLGRTADSNTLLPAVIFVAGYPDAGLKAHTGYRLKELAQYISWAELFASRECIAITYSNTDPKADLITLLAYLFEHHTELGVDKTRIGLFACSGNTPNALNIIMHPSTRGYIQCAALLYGYMPDSEHTTWTSDAAKLFHFVNAECSLSEIESSVPLLIVRSGQDEMPNLNASIDNFVVEALTLNLPISLVNVPHAAHAFDVVNDDDEARKAIKQILSFMKRHLEF